MVLITVELHDEGGGKTEIKRVFLLDTKPMAQNIGKPKFLKKLGLDSAEGWGIAYKTDPAGDATPITDLDTTPFQLKLKKTHVLVVTPRTPTVSTVSRKSARRVCQKSVSVCVEWEGCVCVGVWVEEGRGGEERVCVCV